MSGKSSREIGTQLLAQLGIDVESQGIESFKITGEVNEPLKIELCVLVDGFYSNGLRELQKYKLIEV